MESGTGRFQLTRTAHNASWPRSYRLGLGFLPFSPPAAALLLPGIRGSLLHARAPRASSQAAGHPARTASPRLSSPCKTANQKHQMSPATPHQLLPSRPASSLRSHANKIHPQSVRYLPRRATHARPRRTGTSYLALSLSPLSARPAPHPPATCPSNIPHPPSSAEALVLKTSTTLPEAPRHEARLFF